VYTTQLQAGQGLVDETRALLHLWEPGMTTTQLYQSALTSGRFSNVTARRLRNIVAECFAPRYLADNGVPAESLKTIQSHLTLAELKLLLLLYTARANEILGDFIGDVYWQRYAGGYTEIAKPDAERFVEHAIGEGKTATRWSVSTIRRVSAYILGCCGDYGLLSTPSAGKRRIQAVHLTPTVIAYIAHDLHFRGVSDTALPEDEAWAWFGLESHEVIQRLKEIALHAGIVVQSAASVTQISWRFSSMQEFCDAIAA
jgi:hypothetical protein